MRIQLVILGSTGVLALAMAVVMAVHKPFISGAEARGVEQSKLPVEDEGFRREAPPPSPGAVSSDAISRANLRSLVKKLERTTSPFGKKKIVEKVRSRIGELEPFLLEILADEGDELLVAAIALAGELRMDSAALDLFQLAYAADPRVRSAAIRAYAILRTWPADDLCRFLGGERAFPSHPAVLQAALEACEGREDRPLELIIPLLGHSDQVVRSAAVRATGQLAPGQALEALCSFASRARGLPARAAARALGGSGLARQAETCLLELLRQENWMVVEAALVALSRKESPLLDTEPILHIVADGRRTVRERRYGFIAMESTGSVPVEKIEGLLPSLHPILQLLGARCLITAGDRSGIERVIDLLETGTSESVDADERDCVLTGATAVLEELSGQELGRDRAVWREWLEGLGDVAPQRLRTPPPTLW